MLTCFKSRPCDDWQHTASSTSNLLSTSLSQYSFSENVESKAPMRSCDTSDAYEDVEMLKKLPQSSRASMMTKYSCQIKCSRNTSGTAGFSHKSESSEFPSSKDVFIGNNSQNLQLHSCTRSSNELISHGDRKEMEENSSSQNQAESSECSFAQVGSSLVGPVTNIIIDEQKSLALDSASMLPNNKETCLQSQTFEGSDIVEDDVKVCDICGDAGREDMLAICSRCSDGAEHTYCMRIMLDKVPEGDWLCEECQFKEEAEKQKLDKTKTVTATPKEPSSMEKSFGGTLNPKILPKLDSKADEVEANKASKVIASSLLPAKRHADNLEDSSKSRKLATDTTAGAPGSGSPQKKPALSRENSSKSMDVGKIKQANMVSSSGNQSTNSSNKVTRSCAGSDSSRLQAPLVSPRGLLSRSATFNSLSSKPKVKQLLEDAFQKQKLARESSSSVARKDRLITKSKSLSFRMPSSGRSYTVESKAKMQSSNLSHVEDPRCLKQAKEQTPVERKNSFKLDRPLVSSSAAGAGISLPKVDPKNVSRVESTSSITSVNNSSDPNTPQREGKLKSSNSFTSFAYKGSEKVLVSDGCGEVKKQSSCLSSGFEIPISKGKPNSAERKPYQVGPKEDTAASSGVADELCGNLDVVLQDGLPRSHESTKQDGKMKESSAFSSSKQTTSSTGKNIRCRRCNEFGHLAQVCTASILRVSALKASAARSSQEMSNKSSKWKDAVKAISRTRHKDIRLSDQSEGFSLSSTDLSGDIACKDQLSSSSCCVRNLSSLEGTFDGQEALRSSMADSSITPAIIHVAQHSVHSTETVCAPREANLNAISSNSDGFKLKPYMMKMSSQASLTSNRLRISAIPEHDFLWKGGFEVQRSGRLTDYYDGIQAHMSTCASRRVLELMNKFPCKIQLEEVPRLSLWPTQFQDKATEDNIALYFFAKDLESYERNYKKLLDNLLKNDLALKGNVDRIEILIFPSNQLPEKSQRWNRLFFLWAVFRERRATYSEFLSGSPKKLYGASLDLDRSVQTPVMAEVKTFHETDSYGQKDKELSMCDSSPNAPEAIYSNTVDLPFLSSSERVDGNCYTKASSLDQRPINFHELSQLAIDDTNSSETQAVCSIPEIHTSASASYMTRLHDGCSLSSIPMTNAQICPEVKGDSTSLKEVYRDHKSEKGTFSQPCVQPTTEQNGFNKGKLATLDSDASNCRQALLTSSAADSQGMSSLSSKMHPVSSSRPEEAAPEERLRLMDNVTSLEAERWKEPMEKEQSCWELRSSRKRPYSNFPDAISETSGEVLKETIQTMSWKAEPCIQVDGENNCKKMKSCNDVNVQSSSCEQIIGDGFSSKILGMDLNSLNKEQIGVYAYDNTSILGNSRTTERYLFPVDSGHVRDLKLGNSVPWQILSSDDEDSPEIDVPNLELALGAEKKQPKQGALPLFGQLKNESNNQNKLLGPATDDGGDDLSASLSLSLSFPSFEKEQTAKSASKTEQLLPKRHHVNTSLLLFGGFTDA